ncbi:MarR family winged helix-turn-helix transcriptional regulator [Methylobacterium planeticum]|uniref:MarR family winged helix-turn-helix transcriptional regulator n=1 Tax=Methylobacterium planeticum TaxID=2615211 RepID=UPI003898E840
MGKISDVLAKQAGLSSDAAAQADPAAPPWPLSERPGFLARRLHQIHVSLFAERCAAFRITPLQYSLLSLLAEIGDADQTTLAHAVALDRTTTTGALKRLAARGYIRRATSDADRRARQCALTDEGRALHAAMEQAARAAHEATVSALSPAERETLVRLMKKVAAVHAQRLGAADLLG